MHRSPRLVTGVRGRSQSWRLEWEAFCITEFYVDTHGRDVDTRGPHHSLQSRHPGQQGPPKGQTMEPREKINLSQ